MSVKETNPSFVLQRVGEFAFEDRPVPELIHPTDVLIRIQVTGICGSDVCIMCEIVGVMIGLLGCRFITGNMAKLGHINCSLRLHSAMNLQERSRKLVKE
jgi:hypothetical protein